MALINQLICAVDIKNTGSGTCYLNPSILKGAIEIPHGRRLTASELATLSATILAAISNPIKAQRFFPIGGWKAVTDNSEEPVFQTLGYGTPEPVRDGNYVWIFQYTKGGICLSNALRTRNNGAHGDFLFYDDKGLILGTRHVETDGSITLGGVDVDVFHAYPWKIADGTNVAQYRVQFVFTPEQLNEGLGFVKESGFNPATLSGLQNINLVPFGAPAAGVSNLQALTGCAQTNLFDEFAGELDTLSLWTAYNNATGAQIAITSVAQNVGAKAFTVTLDDEDPDYPANATDKVRIQLGDVAALEGAGIDGYEALPVVINRG